MREAVPPVFHEHPLLKPYNIFDVSSGREQRGGSNGGSLRNQARRRLIHLCVADTLSLEALQDRKSAQ